MKLCIFCGQEFEPNHSSDDICHICYNTRKIGEPEPTPAQECEWRERQQQELLESQMTANK